MTVTGRGARRKGSQFERDVVEYLRSHGFPYCERAYGGGRPDDRGDIDGVVGWVLELKNQKTMELAKWLDEAAREAGRWPGRPDRFPNPLMRKWAVIMKRRNRPVADAYVVMSLEQFAALLTDDDTMPGSRRYGVER